MKKLILAFAIIHCYSLTFAQQDTLFRFDLHYRSSNIGPQGYFYNGDRLTIDYAPKIGSATIILLKQTQSTGFSSRQEILVKEQKGLWQYDYIIENDGCYALKFKPDGDLSYLSAQVKISRLPGPGNKNKPNSCTQFFSADSTEVGGERFMTLEEIMKTGKKVPVYSVNKEISSNGLEYCDTKIKLSPNQGMIVSFKAEDNDPRINLQVFKAFNGKQTHLFSDFQYTINEFGFRSLKGGEYTIRFWGRDVFKRTDDLVVQLTR